MVTVHVVSHDDAPERLVNMWADADRLGLDLRREGVSAPSGDADDAADLEAHASCWRHLIEGRAGFAAIVHDDVMLEDGLRALLHENVLKAVMPERGVMVLDALDIGDGEDAEPRVHRLARVPSRPSAYIISRETAADALGVREQGAGSVQAVLSLSTPRRGELLAVVPSVVSKDDAADGASTRLVDRTRKAMRRVAQRLGDRSEGVRLPQPSKEEAKSAVSA